MKKIQLTQKQVALVDDSDYDYLNQWNWFALKDKKSFYAARTIRIGKTFKKILMHRLIMSPPDNKQIDHINGNKLDNRRSNLRICSINENRYNQGPLKSNTSGYKGVSWHIHSKKWIARITVNGNRKFLGYFANKKDAGHAYNKAAIRYHKEFAFKRSK